MGSIRFKAYDNPLYADVQPEEWTSGLCCIFANALRERFGLPMRALFVQSKHDESNRTLVHAFGVLPDGRCMDATGVRSEPDVMHGYAVVTPEEWRVIHCAQPGEEIDLVFRDVTLDELWDLNPEDHEATNAAHAYIESKPELFAYPGGEFSDAVAMSPRGRTKRREIGMGQAFAISEEDVENVLRRNWAKIDSGGAPFDVMAEKLFLDIDEDRVESAALASGGDLEEQTEGAYREIEAILVEMGVMKGPSPQCSASPKG